VQVASTVTPQPSPRLFDELSRTVVCKLHQGSTVTSMEFHPSIRSRLAGRLKYNTFFFIKQKLNYSFYLPRKFIEIETVGCENGKISLWEARLRKRLISKSSYDYTM
jgi:hypothetical protein